MITAYKGFEPDMTCRGFQYELGKTYSLPERPKLCERGFHTCILPIDVVQYYPYNLSVYAKVKLSDDYDSMLDLYDFAFGTKFCGRRIWISTRTMCMDELIYETFHLLDQLAVFADLCVLPSEYYYRVAKTSIKQFKDAVKIDERIEATIRFAHHILGLIINKLMDSNQIFNSMDFIQIVIKLQQTKEEENAANV